VYDLQHPREWSYSFAKCPNTWDPNLIHLLPVERSEDIPPIQWPEEVAMSEKPDWEKRKVNHCQGKKKTKGKRRFTMVTT
jgi:hypothetical protein